MKWLPFICRVVSVAVLAACAGSPQLAYQSAPDETAESNAVDSGEARALNRPKPIARVTASTRSLSGSRGRRSMIAPKATETASVSAASLPA